MALWSPTPVYAFVSVGESRGGAVQNVSRTWAEDLGLAVLIADFRAYAGERDLDAGSGKLDLLKVAALHAEDLHRLLAEARSHYDVICADLGSSDAVSADTLRVADCIFFVSDSSPASLELVRQHVEKVVSWGVEDSCGILLRRVEGGLRPDLAEEFTGAPVCGLVENRDHITQLAQWLAPDRRPAAAA